MENNPASENTEPEVGTYADTARFMAEIFPDYGWDNWKDEMKELS